MLEWENKKKSPLPTTTDWCPLVGTPQENYYFDADVPLPHDYVVPDGRQKDLCLERWA